MPGRRVLRLVAAVLAGLAAGSAGGGAAHAHGADAPRATDHRTTVTGVSPAVAGLTVRVIEAGARLQLANGTGRTIEVLGEAGEPYLAIRPDGVYENVHSPATYRNETLAGDTPVPATADPTRPPTWRLVSDEPVARWHDRRARWTGPPPAAAAAGSAARQAWRIPLRDGVREMEVHGAVQWLTPPAAVAWWAGAAAVAVAVAAVGRRGRRRSRLLAALVGVAGLMALGYAAARRLDAGASDAGAVLAGVLIEETWQAVAGVAAVAVGVALLIRRNGLDFPLALAGAGLGLFAGLRNAAVLASAVAPVPGPSWWARLAVVTVLGVGAGAAAAAVLRLRADGRRGVGSDR